MLTVMLSIWLLCSQAWITLSMNQVEYYLFHPKQTYLFRQLALKTRKVAVLHSDMTLVHTSL